MVRLTALVLVVMLVGCASTPRPAGRVESDVEAIAREAGAPPRHAPRRAASKQLPAARATTYSTRPLGVRFARALPGAPADAPRNVEFYIFDLGQADAMLVVGPPPERRTLLIDTGELNWNSRAGCNHVRDRVHQITGKYHVDFLLVTHYHLDHIGYFRAELQNGRIFEGGGIFCLLGSTPSFFTVGTLIDSGPTDPAWQPERKYIDAIQEGVPDWIAAGVLGDYEAAQFGVDQIDLGPGVVVDVVVTDGRVSSDDDGLHAELARAEHDLFSAEQPASPNDFSVGVEISVGDFELLTAGDLTGAPGAPPYASYEIKRFRDGSSQVYSNVESRLARHWIASDRESDVEVYRANHHGSGNSSTEDLALLLEPELVIYSCGGKHGHPDRTIADRFLALGADQLVTRAIDWRDTNDVFPAAYGGGWDNPVGEVSIVVPLGGAEYTVATSRQAWSYPIRSDADEVD